MIEIIIKNEKVDYDEIKKYRCGRCSAVIYKAIMKKDGRETYIHKTINNFAEHKELCPHKNKKIDQYEIVLQGARVFKGDLYECKKEYKKIYKESVAPLRMQDRINAIAILKLDEQK